MKTKIECHTRFSNFKQEPDDRKFIVKKSYIINLLIFKFNSFWSNLNSPSELTF